jgi:dUTP pyrophosphatase
MSGSLLTNEDLAELLGKEPPLIEGMIDPYFQVGPDGIDLTIKSVERFRSAGVIDFNNACRVLAQTEKVEFDENDYIFLTQGAYKIVFNEVVNIPNDLIAFAFPRSTLLRCGASVKSAIWDSGYRGRSTSLLTVFNLNGLKIKRNARVVQLIFFKTTKPVKETYSGIYQMENMVDLGRKNE